jgi:hypothetical protein
LRVEGVPRNWKPAPPDPGIIPGGIRDRALRTLHDRAGRPEDLEKTRASQAYWANLRREREAAAEARRNGLPPPPREPSIWFAVCDGGEATAIGALPEEYSNLAQELRVSGVLAGEFYTRAEALKAAREAVAERIPSAAAAAAAAAPAATIEQPSTTSATRVAAPGSPYGKP